MILYNCETFFMINEYRQKNNIYKDKGSNNNKNNYNQKRKISALGTLGTLVGIGFTIAILIVVTISNAFSVLEQGAALSGQKQQQQNMMAAIEAANNSITNSNTTLMTGTKLCCSYRWL